MINTDSIMTMVSVPPEERQPVDLSNNTLHLPLIGRINFVNDSEGWGYLSAVVAYWIYGTFVIYYIILEPLQTDGVIPSIFVYGYLAICALCLVSLIRSTFTNPGRIPTFDSSSMSEEGWTLCTKCNRMRPPRSHHCRRCGQCVLRMDHHCPWINNCVGENNHFVFLQLLAYAFLLSLSALIFIMGHFWVFPKCVSCNKEAFHIKHSIWFMYLAFVLSLNMMFMMGVQYYGQHINVLINRTTLENMMSAPNLNNVEFHKMYNSYREVCGQGSALFWWSPFRRRRPCVPVYPGHNIV